MIKLEDIELSIFNPARPAEGSSLLEYPVTINCQSIGLGMANGVLKHDLNDKDFQFLLKRVRSAERDLALRESFGKMLFNVLFTDDIKAQWVASIARHENLRIRLQVEPPELAILPWELLYDPNLEFLSTATNLVFSRYFPQRLEWPLRPIDDKVRILLVAESPHDLPAAFDTEFSQLVETIENTGNNVELHVLRNKPIDDIHRALQIQTFHIFHFLGHGIDGGLALTDALGNLDRIDDNQFAQLLQGTQSIRLVVLNACDSKQSDPQNLFSGVGPALIKKRIPAVIAMQYPVTVKTATKFSEKFYQALANGFPVDFAVNQARNFLSAGDLLDGRDWNTPIIYTGTRRGEELSWNFTTGRVNSPTHTSIEMPIVGDSINHAVQEIVHHANCIEEWLLLHEKLWQLQVIFDDVVKAVTVVNTSDVSKQNNQMSLVRKSWEPCNNMLKVLNAMAIQFRYINVDIELVPDDKNFTVWIDELSELGEAIQHMIVENSFRALERITVLFLNLLEQHTKTPLSIARTEAQELIKLAMHSTNKD